MDWWETSMIRRPQNSQESWKSPQISCHELVHRNSYSDVHTNMHGIDKHPFSHMRRCCVWGKVPCDFLFSGARATSCFSFICCDFHPLTIHPSPTLLASLLALRSFVRLSLVLFSPLLLLRVWVNLWVKGEWGEKSILAKSSYKSPLDGKRRKEKPFVVKLDFHFEKHQVWVLISLPSGGQHRLLPYMRPLSLVLLVGKSIFIWNAKITKLFSSRWWTFRVLPSASGQINGALSEL